MTQPAPTADLDGLVDTTTQVRSTEQPYGNRAQVLSQADSQSALLDVPVAICCPNCSEAVTLYERGLPGDVPYFDTACTQCDIDLRTWCAVGVDAAYLQIVIVPAALRSEVTTG